METHTRSEQSQQISQSRKIQNGDTRNNPDLPPDRGVGNVHRLQGRLLPHTHTKPIKKTPEISGTGQTYQFKALPFGLSTAPLEFTVVAKEVKLMALQKCIRIHQYLDDWLVRARSHQICLQHTTTLVTLSGPRLVSKFGKIRTGTQTGFRLCRLPVRSERGQGQAQSRPVADT